MPKISNILENNSKQRFKKRSYRSYNPEGTDLPEESKTDKLVNLNIDISNNILEVDCDDILNWEYSDRPIEELGDIYSFAKELQKVGQQQPCIVRNINNKKNDKKYELIAGERRWRAAKIANIKLKVIVKDINNLEAAVIQSSENNNRKDLSDYAKGMSYYRLINNEIISQKELSEKIGISKQQISRYLSYNKIPSEIKDEIEDFSKVSPYTAETIKQLCIKSESHKNAIKSLANKIREGLIGSEKLSILVKRKVESLNHDLKINKSFTNKLYDNKGLHLLTWKRCKNSINNLVFSNDINDMINRLNDDQKANISNEIIDLIKSHSK